MVNTACFFYRLAIGKIVTDLKKNNFIMVGLTSLPNLPIPFDLIEAYNLNPWKNDDIQEGFKKLAKETINQDISDNYQIIIELNKETIAFTPNDDFDYLPEDLLSLTLKTSPFINNPFHISIIF